MAHVKRRRQRRCGQEIRDVDEYPLGRRVCCQRAKILLRIRIHIGSSKKRHIEVSRCETKSASSVLTQDNLNAIRLGCAHCIAHSSLTMVVSRYCESPVLKHIVVVTQQASRSDSGKIGVTSFVNDVIDSHIAKTGGSGELPHARSTHLRIRRGIE